MLRINASTQTVDPQNTFSSRLENLCQEFILFTDEERNQALEHLISKCGNQQFRFLGSLLPLLLYRDFLSLLPTEISIHIVKFLDSESLFNCCLVSKTWNRIINNFKEIWINLLDIGGAKSPDNICYPAQVFKDSFLTMCKWIDEMGSGEAFEKIYLTGHQSRVMAVYYQNGKVATGSDDHRVRIWDTSNGECLLAVRTPSVSDIKFDDIFLYIASYDNSVICYDIESGREKHRYIGHVSAVLSIDFDRNLNLLLTGSADRTVKIWQIHSGKLLNSITDFHGNWVLQVKFVNLEMNVNKDMKRSEKKCPTRPTFISSSKEQTFVWVIETSGDILTERQLNNPSERLPFGIPVLSFRDTLFFYWSDPDGQQYITEKQCTVNEGLNSIAVKVKTLCSRPLPDEMPTNSIFIGCGNKFAVFIAQETTEYLVMINMLSTEIVTYLPFQQCRPTMNGASVSLGERAWLDGLSEENQTGLILATCLKNNNVLLLKWKPVMKNTILRSSKTVGDVT